MMAHCQLNLILDSNCLPNLWCVYSSSGVNILNSDLNLDHNIQVKLQ